MSKSRKSADTTTVEDILRDHTSGIVNLTQRLREIVTETVPEAVESAHAVWNSLNFHHPECGYFCGIFLRPDSSTLAFEFGVLLSDPDGLLEGNGKQVKFVRFTDERQIRVRPLKKLIRAALDLPPERDVKMAMIRAKAEGSDR